MTPKKKTKKVKKVKAWAIVDRIDNKIDGWWTEEADGFMEMIFSSRRLAERIVRKEALPEKIIPIEITYKI